MRKYDKSLVEVWEWKEDVYNETKDLTAREYVKKIKEDADSILAGHRTRLTTVSPRGKSKKVA